MLYRFNKKCKQLEREKEMLKRPNFSFKLKSFLTHSLSQGNEMKQSLAKSNYLIKFNYTVKAIRFLIKPLETPNN